MLGEVPGIFKTQIVFRILLACIHANKVKP